MIEGYGAKCLRVLLLAYRDFSEEQNWDKEDDYTNNLTLQVLVGIQVGIDKRSG